MRSRILLIVAAAGLVLSGCGKDPQEDGTGRFRISFSSDATVAETTRTPEGLVAPQAEEFSLRVVSADGTSYDETWDDITEYPGEGYFIAAGNYTATALCGDIETEGFGYPCFGVTKNFTVVAGVTTPVTLTAKLINMAVTVDYTDEFKGYFPTRNAVILRNGAELADFTADPAGVAYIKPEAFQLRVDYVNQSGQSGSTVPFDITDQVGACTHLKIKLDVNHGGVGDASIVVNFNGDVETVELPVIETGEEE